MTFTLQQLKTIAGQLNEHIEQMTDKTMRAKFCGCNAPGRITKMHPAQRAAFAIFKHYNKDQGENIFIVDGATKLLVPSKEKLTEILKSLDYIDFSSPFCLIRSTISAETELRTSLDAVVDIMRNNTEIKAQCALYQKLMKKGDVDAAKDIKKKTIPAFFPCAIMSGGKGRKDVIGLTGYGVIDIDHIPEEQMNDALEKVRCEPHTVLAARSISTQGMHIIFRYRFTNLAFSECEKMMSNRLNMTYVSVAKPIAKFYSKLIEWKVDKKCLHVERTMLLSHDKDLFYNKDATPFDVEYVQYKVSKYGVKSFKLQNLSFDC